MEDALVALKGRSGALGGAYDDDLSSVYSSILNSVYEDALTRVDSQPERRRKLAREVLMRTIHAHRELSVQELQEAVAIQAGRQNLEKYLVDPEMMVSVCHGLIETDQKGQVIRLVHYTTQEYFEMERGRWFLNGDLNITRRCLVYLSMNIFAHRQQEWNMDLKTIVYQHKFLEYAGKCWGVHARTLRNKELQADIANFLSNSDYLRFSTMVTFGELNNYLGVYPCHKSSVSAIHISAYFGLEEVTQDLLRQGTDLNCKDDRLWTPLLYAVEEGRIELVRLLLAQSDVEASRDEQGRTSLTISAERGHIEILKLLLKRFGTERNVEDEDGYTPLSRAANRGDTEMVKLLLAEPDINPNTEDNYDDTPLSRAAVEGHVEVVELLLARPDVKVHMEEYGDTALSRAAGGEHVGIVKLLLAHPNTEINMMDKFGDTALARAAERGRTEILELLLTQPGIQVNTKNMYGDTPFCQGAEGGHVEILKLLLARSDVHINTGAPLSLAAREGHVKVVKLLLAQPSIEVNMRDKYGYTALSGAAQRGCIEILKLLLAEPSIELNAQNQNDNTALSVAAKEGHIKVVQLPNRFILSTDPYVHAHVNTTGSTSSSNPYSNSQHPLLVTSQNRLSSTVEARRDKSEPDEMKKRHGEVETERKPMA